MKRDHFKFVRTDGGRKAAGFSGHIGDCVIRAIAIATRRKYARVYEDLARYCLAAWEQNTRCRVRTTFWPHDGVPVWVYKCLLDQYGWRFVKTDLRKKIKLRPSELPSRAIDGLWATDPNHPEGGNGHSVYVSHGVLFDTWRSHESDRSYVVCAYFVPKKHRRKRKSAKLRAKRR